MNKNDFAIPAWLDDALQNWVRWHWLERWQGPGPSERCGSAEGLYRAPNCWGETEPYQPPPNEAHAQRVEQAYQRMDGRERQVSSAKYLRPWSNEDAKAVIHLCPSWKSWKYRVSGSGRWRYGRVGAACSLRMSLNSYETLLRCACLKVEQAFGQ